MEDEVADGSSSKLSVRLLLVGVSNEVGDDSCVLVLLNLSDLDLVERTKEETDSVPSPWRRLENLRKKRYLSSCFTRMECLSVCLRGCAFEQI